MNQRSEKVSSVIKKIIVTPINEIARDHKAGMVTVTSVKMSPDLQIAKIYISSFAGKISPISFLTILENEQYKIKEEIARKARLRYIPELRFFLDDTLDQMENIQNLIKKVKSDSDDSQ